MSVLRRSLGVTGSGLGVDALRIFVTRGHARDFRRQVGECGGGFRRGAQLGGRRAQFIRRRGDAQPIKRR